MTLSSQQKQWLVWGVIALALLIIAGVLWFWISKAVASLLSAFGLLLGADRLQRYTDAEREALATKEQARQEAAVAERKAIEEAAAAKRAAKQEQSQADTKTADAIDAATTKAKVDQVVDDALDEHEKFLNQVAPSSQGGFVRSDFLVWVLCATLTLLLASFAWGKPTLPSQTDRTRAERVTRLLNRYKRALKDAHTKHREEVARLKIRAAEREKGLRGELKACTKQKLILSKQPSCWPYMVGGAAGSGAVCLVVVGGLFATGVIKRGSP